MRHLDLLKKRKYIVGGTTAVAVVITACTMGSVPGKQVKLAGQEYTAGSTAEVATDTDALITDVDDLADKLSDSVNVSEKDVDKDETVYVFADSNGKVDNVLVNETLKNRDNKAQLTDETELKDIVNVKGDETFTQNGNKVTWEANGNEISYQGTSDKELPVQVKATYYLNDKEVTPAEIAGESGRVKIRFDYSSNATVDKEINGKKETISVPFIAVTGMMLGDNFTNISVENGKYLEQGESNIVVGYAMPGLESSLGDMTKDVDLEIPNYVEVSADVEDFSLDMTVTLVMNGSSMSIDGGLDLADMDEITSNLKSAGNQLANGSTELADGAGTLADEMGELVTGAGTLAEGVNTLAGGADTLSNGVGTLDASAQGIATGINTLDQGLKAPMSTEQKQATANQASAQAVSAVEANFVEGTDTYNQIYNQAASAYETGITGATEAIYQSYLQSAYPSMYQSALAAAATQAYAAGNVTAGLDPAQVSYTVYYANYITDPNVQAAVSQTVKDSLYAMASETTAGIAAQGKDATAKSVVAACKQSATTTASQVAASAAISGAEEAKATIAAQIETVQANGYSLVTGANALAQGTSTLKNSVPALTDGINRILSGANTLSNGAGLLKDGADQVATGAGTLSDNLVLLNNDAIQKMVKTYNGDVKDLVDRSKVAMEAATEYDSFAGRADDAESTTKFIIKTAGIYLD